LPPIQDQEHRPLLLQGPSLGLRLAILATAALALMVADHRQQYLGVVRGWLSVAAYPVLWAVDAPSSAWRFVSETLTTRGSLEEENTRLSAANRELRLRLLRLDALEQENRRLREARASSARVAERSLVAEILKVDLDPAIPVQINRTGVRTIAVGQGQTGSLLLPYLPRNADVVEGDLLVSSGLGGVFPPGYPVARVSEVRQDPAEPLLAVSATPLAQLDRDPEVLLVWFDNRIVEPADEPDTGTTDGQHAGPGAAEPPGPAESGQTLDTPAPARAAPAEGR
jgi:rod shape-determining protein MreC